MLIAANRLAAGDEDAALRAMRRAATSPETRVYWPETIELIARGFAAGSDLPFADRAVSAFGIAATKQRGYLAHFEMCRDQSATNESWARACLAYGELAERQGKTELGQTAARSIQQRALESLGLNDRAAEVAARQEQRRRDRIESSTAHGLLVDALVHSNPAIFSDYLAVVRIHGEVAARRYLQEEAERWLSRQPAIDCIE